MGFLSFLNPFKGSALNPAGYTSNPMKPPGGFDPAGIFGGGGGNNSAPADPTSNGLGSLGMQGHVNAGEPGRDGPRMNGSWAGMSPQQPGMNNRADWLTSAGYTGPMPGTPEFQAARQAGQRPIMDWRQAQGYGQGWSPQSGSYGNGNGNAGGEMPHQGWNNGINPGGWPSQPQPQGIAVGEPNPNGLGVLSGRRPNPMLGR